VPIVRRNNCIYATPGTCHSVWMTVRYAYQTVTQNMYRKEINIPRKIVHQVGFIYEGWNFNSGNYLFTTDTK